MDRLDIESLLVEVSPESSCGENLEYAEEFVSLVHSVQKKEIQNKDGSRETVEPPWNEIRKSAIKLLSRTKDLRVACFLTLAQTNLNGLIGFSDSINFLSNLVEKYWDSLYPQLDPDDHNDPTERINILMSLCDQSSVLGDLTRQTIVESRGLGSFSYRDLMIAQGKLKLPQESLDGKEGQTVPDMKVIDAAFLGCNLDVLKENFTALQNAFKDIESLDVFLTETLGADKTPSFEKLSKTLMDMGKIIKMKLSNRGEGDGSESLDVAGNQSGFVSGQEKLSKGEIASREDVVRALDKICTYYEKNEPSSPIPLLLQRAKRLVSKDFMEIIQDLSPDGLKQVEGIRGKIE